MIACSTNNTDSLFFSSLKFESEDDDAGESMFFKLAKAFLHALDSKKVSFSWKKKKNTELRTALEHVWYVYHYWNGEILHHHVPRQRIPLVLTFSERIKEGVKGRV